MKKIKRYCYITIPIITVILISIICIIRYKFFNFFVITEHITNDTSTLIQIAGTLIGFLLTAMTVFLSLPKETKLMQKIKKYNHHKIFSYCVTSGLVILTLDILLWILKFSTELIIIFFLLGLEETLMAAYYIYKLCIYNFE